MDKAGVLVMQIDRLEALLTLQPEAPFDRNGLITALEQLIEQDIARLVQLLYRFDVPEQQLKQRLQEQPHTNAADIIADLLMARREEKRRSRQAHQSPPPTGPDAW